MQINNLNKHFSIIYHYIRGNSIKIYLTLCIIVYEQSALLLPTINTSQFRFK